MRELDKDYWRDIFRRDGRKAAAHIGKKAQPVKPIRLAECERCGRVMKTSIDTCLCGGQLGGLTR